MTRVMRTQGASASVSSRLSDVLANRRTAGIRARIPPAAATPPAEPAQAPAPRRTPRRAATPPVAHVVRHAAPQEPVPVDGESTVLLDILQRSRYEPRPARTGQYLHVSDLISRCVRKFAIMERHQIAKTPQRLSLMDVLTFNVGDSIHDTIKQRVTSGSPSQVWGRWRCKCGTYHTEDPCTFAEIDPTHLCTACGEPATIYEEVPMRDEDLMIVGTPDLLLYLADMQAFYVTELKSIAHARWEEMSRPLPDHVIQVLFYWYLMRKLGYVVADHVSILYVTKGYLFTGSPCKEYTINASESIHRLEPYLDMARGLKASRQDGTLPPRVICASDTAAEAKKCEVCSICFGGSHAAPQTISIATALRRPATPARKTR